MVTDAERAEAPPPVSVWDQLRDVADPTMYRPALRPGLVSQQLKTRWGEDYVIVQNPVAATYLRLSLEDFTMLGLMDGSRTVQALVVEYMLRFRRFALQHFSELVSDLRQSEFLADAPSNTYPRVRRLARPGGLWPNADNLLNLYLNREFPIRGVDEAFDRLYRGGAWLLLTPPGLVVLALLTLIGIPLLVWDLHVAHIALTNGALLARYAVLGYLSLLAIAIIHELGHAFAVKSYGRAVRRGGLGLFYGSPCLYVDTQDMWMARRGARIAASWAGPYSGFILAGIAGFALTVLPQGSWVTFARAFGITALIENAFQLNPFIQYDGYYMLMDWLDIYNLRARALTFIRFDLWGKLWRRERFSQEETVFAVFGLLASAYTVFAIFLAVTFGWDHARTAIQNAIRVPNLGSLFLAILLALILIPFAIGVAGRLIGLARTLLRSAGRAGGAARQRWLRERMTLLAQVPVLAKLGEEPIQALAGCVREERFRSGQAIVRQGEPGSRFYLVAAGSASVSIDDGRGARIVTALGPMDYFGERALIEQAPRAATVRATSSLRLLSLSSDDFRSSIRPYVAADAALRARLNEVAELDQFKLLEPLGVRDREILLSRLEPRDCAPATEIVTQGGRGDAFYLIRAGNAEVTRRVDSGAEQWLQTLGPGDFFGEIALVYETPRVATVRALEPMRLWRLRRADFNDLLSKYLNLGERLEPALSERLDEDQLIALDHGPGTETIAAGSATPDIAFVAESGAGVRLSSYRGRRVMVWFHAGDDLASLGSPAGTGRLLGALEAGGLTTVFVDPRAGSSTGEFNAQVLHDPEDAGHRSFGMYVPIAAPKPEQGNEWNVAMDGLGAGTPGRILATRQEGFAVIGADGVIEQIWRSNGGSSLPSLAALVEGMPA